jgi:NAD(P)-dependent dehydrogenase (short-subunit alcohol dehydrogenase family)
VDDFTGRVALVTGAARGCGRAIAEDLAARGARVVVNDIDADRGRDVVAGIAAGGGTATFVEADVGREAEVERLVGAAVDAYGALHCAVNNAGTEHVGAIDASDAATFAEIIATNLEGVRACLKHEIAAMRRSGGGAIVNMSSVTSDLTAVPQNGLYAATKGGVDALTKTAAVEVAKDGISVNALAFLGADVEDGMFQRFLATTGTPVEQILGALPVGRLLRKQELCAAVRFLCGDDSRFVTGTVLVMDGGYTAM